MSFDMSLISASRVDHINKSATEDEAVKMGFLDKIVYYFRGKIFGNSKEETIKTLYHLIQDMKASNSCFDAFEKFSDLRSKALPEHREKFSADICKQKNEEWCFSLSIDGNRILAGNIESYEDIKNIPQLINKQLSMKMEDAFCSGKIEPLLSTLEEIARKIDEEWYVPSRKDSIDAVARNKFAEEKMEDVISSLPTETKESIYSQVTGKFGNRLRGVLGYATEVVSLAIDPQHKLLSPEKDAVLLSAPTKIESRFNSLVTILSTSLGKLEQKISMPDEIGASKELTMDEIDALKNLGIKDSIISLK